MLGVGVHRDAATVVPHGQGAVRIESHLDEPRMAGDGLVHGVVQHLCEEVVQGPLVRAADVHARPHAHRLEPFEDLDVLGGIAALARRRGWGGRSRRRRLRGP